MKGTLTIDPNNQISRIDERIYGSFIEQLGRAVYNGIYQPGQVTADKDGLRQDVIDAIKKIKCPNCEISWGQFCFSI